MEDVPVTIVDVIHVVAMGHGHVTTFHTVLVLVVVVYGMGRQLTFIDVIFMGLVQAPVVNVVDVVFMGHCNVPTTKAVLVLVACVRTVFSGNGHASPSISFTAGGQLNSNPSHRLHNASNRDL
jgi:hypothetical protein